MIKFFRTAAACAAAVVLAVLFAVQAQASPQVAAQSQPGDSDLIFAGVVALAILGAAFGVIIYAARHRNSEH